MFATSTNPLTGLNATVVLEPGEQAPHSVWLYLSNGDKIISDCLLANLVEPKDSMTKPENRDAPPPVLRHHLTSGAPSATPRDEDLRFIWSKSGKDVAVAISGVDVGFIVSGEKRGYSRALSQKGPWGNPWSDELFDACFAD